MIDKNEIIEYRKIFKYLKKIYKYIPEANRTITIPTIFNSIYNENFISDYLAYILDPNLNGIGLSPLIKIIQYLDSENNMKDDRNMDFKEVNIFREYTFNGYNNIRIDLLILIDENIVVGIENKTLSKEHSRQTIKYRKAIESEFPNREKLFIYLTIDGDKALSKEFTPLDYNQLLKMMRSNEHISKNLKKTVIFNDFISHLEVYFVDNKKIKFNKKTELFLDNYQMINDLENSFREDKRHIIKIMSSIFKEHFGESKLGVKWNYNFNDSRDYHQIYLDNWNSKIFVHMEIHFGSIDHFINKTFYLMIDVEGNKQLKEKFINIYENEYSKEYYYNNNIDYRNHRNLAVAYKKYQYKGFPDFANVLEESILEFEPIINYILNTFKKYEESE